MNGKRVLSVILSICMVLSMLPANVMAVDWPEVPVKSTQSVRGTTDAPQLVDGYYEIYNSDQLYWFAAKVNGGSTSINGKLMADIVVNENVLKADGTLNGDGSNFRTWTTMSSFSGTFDGNRHTISGLYMNGTSFNCGFVGSLSSTGVVMNLTIVDSYFSGDSYVGGIAADNDGVISCCFNSAAIKATFSAGGIAGQNGGTIINCGNTGTIIVVSSGYGSNFRYAGGITGKNWNGSVGNCFSLASVSGSDEDGIAGDKGGYVVNSYANMGVSSRIKSVMQFASGEVAYLLQADQADQVWGQIIGTDGAPVLFGEPIYYLGGHYSNGPANSDAHYYVNGICAGCGAFEAPVVKNGVAEIYTANQLYWYANQVNLGDSGLHGKLMANITINGSVLNADGTLRNGTFREWVPIGTSERPFIGTFAGNGFTISGLFMDTTEDHVGLFGYISKGVVKNVVIADSYFSGGSCVGSVVGYNYLGIIKNCYTAATVDGESAVGGIVGYSYSNYSGPLASNMPPVLPEDCFGDDDCYGCNGGEYYVGGCYCIGRVNGSGIIGVFEDRHLSEGGSLGCYYLSGAANGGINGQDITGKAEPKEAEFFDCNNIELIPHSWFSADCDSPRVCTICGASDSTASLHNYVDGCCTRCGMTETPVLVDGYYEIYTADHLYWFAAKVNGGSTSIKGKLMADIVVNRNVLNADGSLNGDGSNFRVWTPIGNSGKEYTGTFDGNGKTISGLYFNNASVSYVGLFGYLGDMGSVRNVGIIDSYLKGCNYVGGVVGSAYSTLWSIDIIKCFSSATVIGDDYVGGIVGRSYGDMTDISVQDCYNTGAVSGNKYVGGVVGYNYCSDDLWWTYVYRCYNSGNVSGSYYVGSVVGYNQNGYISNCYYLTGSAKDGAGKVQNGLGNAAKGSATADASGKTTGKTAAQFASGEVAYLLGEAFGQAIGTDAYPVLGGATVYLVDGEYSNYKPCSHSWSEATCTEPKTCTTCGETSGVALGHDWMDATCTKPKTCSACGATSGAIGTHSYVNGFCSYCDGYQPATKKSGGFYSITNAGQLYWFAEQVNGGNTSINGRLLGNIVINQGVLATDGTLASGSFRQWTPIGSSESPYIGTFDGNGCAIVGLYIDTDGDDVGLFGAIGKGVVKNLYLADSYVRGGTHVGGIVGANRLGIIINCVNAGSINGQSAVGGIVGYSYSNYSGPLASNMPPVLPEDCFEDDDCYGCNGNAYCVSNCYSIGYVTGGGIIGVYEDEYKNQGGFTNCYYLHDRAYDISNGGTPMTAEQFASGEVAYLLRTAFGQTIGTDEYPVLGGAKIYKNQTGGCIDSTYTYAYSNTSAAAVVTHNWEVSSCTTPKTCTDCGATEGNALGHIWCDATCTEPKTCIVCGKTTGLPLGHDWTDATCTEPQNCSVCGAISGVALGHRWNAATCTEPKTCKVCGTKYGSALGHSWEDATCTKPKTCSVCGETSGSALGHKWNAATCTEPKTCKVCGTKYGSALGHIEVVIPGYAATYDAPGLTDGSYCSRCGETVQEQQPIAPIAEEVTFTYKAYGINGSANAVNSGYITLEVWMNVNSDRARLWGADLSLSFNENLTLMEISGGIFAESLATPLDTANAYHAVKLTQDMGYSGDKTFSKGQYLFATLTFKVDKGFCGQKASFLIDDEECTLIRMGAYANALVSDFGTGVSIHVSKLGDADLNGRITAADTMALSAWFQTSDLDEYNAVFDLNKDGYIDGDDFALLRGAVVWDDGYLDT